MEENRLAASFAKNTREMIFVGANFWKDKWRIYMRTYFPGTDEGKDWIPTKKGISLEFDQYDALYQALLLLGSDLENERDVAVIGKTITQEIRISLSYFKEMALINIRTYVDFEGEMRPTQKGISIKTSLYPQLWDAIEKLGVLIKEIPSG
jgi:hypothetical protein